MNTTWVSVADEIYQAKARTRDGRKKAKYEKNLASIGRIFADNEETLAPLLSIDKNYLRTFVWKKSAVQYTCDRFKIAKEDSVRFDAIFWNRLSYTEPIHEEVKAWVNERIDTWMYDEEDWFFLSLIPDSMLPRDVFHAAGGISRIRSSPSLILSDRALPSRFLSSARFASRAAEKKKSEVINEHEFAHQN